VDLAVTGELLVEDNVVDWNKELQVAVLVVHADVEPQVQELLGLDMPLGLGVKIVEAKARLRSNTRNHFPVVNAISL
jgi:hypothetical protein